MSEFNAEDTERDVDGVKVRLEQVEEQFIATITRNLGPDVAYAWQRLNDLCNAEQSVRDVWYHDDNGHNVAALAYDGLGGEVCQTIGRAGRQFYRQRARIVRSAILAPVYRKLYGGDPRIAKIEAHGLDNAPVRLGRLDPGLALRALGDLGPLDVDALLEDDDRWPSDLQLAVLDALVEARTQLKAG